MGPFSSLYLDDNSNVRLAQTWDVASCSSVDVVADRPQDEELPPPPDSFAMPVLSAPSPIVHQGLVTVRGLLKQENQDRVVARSDVFEEEKNRLHGPAELQRKPVVYCAVFDGHGGSNAATLASQRLQQILHGHEAIRRVFDHMRRPTRTPTSMPENEDGFFLQRIWSEAFNSLDNEILSMSRQSGQVDGSTALCGLHAGPFLFVANAGDSRAVLARGKHAVRITRDHKPEIRSEKLRIEGAGGKVQFVKGSWRVLLPCQNSTQTKICATSRGLGDLDFKEKSLLTCEPEVVAILLQPFVDTFSIFASDGVWGFVSDQDVVDAVYEVILEYSKMTRAQQGSAVAQAAAKRVVKLALDHGSVDDISVVVNLLDWGPPPVAGSAAALQQAQSMRDEEAAEAAATSSLPGSGANAGGSI